MVGTRRSGITVKVNLDDVAFASEGGRQGGAAGLLHQGYAVTVLDCHVVAAAGITVVNIKCRELHLNNQPLLDFDDLRLPQIHRIVARVVW